MGFTFMCLPCGNGLSRWIAATAASHALLHHRRGTRTSIGLEIAHQGGSSSPRTPPMPSILSMPSTPSRQRPPRAWVAPAASIERLLSRHWGDIASLAAATASPCPPPQAGTSVSYRGWKLNGSFHAVCNKGSVPSLLALCRSGTPTSFQTGNRDCPSNSGDGWRGRSIAGRRQHRGRSAANSPGHLGPRGLGPRDLA